jgi:hypothetical protein
MSTWTSEARSRVPRIAEAAVERARLTVVPRAPRGRAARVPFVTLVSLLLVGGVAGLLCFNTSMQQSSFRVTALEAHAAALDSQEQSLTLQLGTLRDPQQVALRAKRLGMVPPPSPAFLRLSDGKVLGSAVPATVADAVRVTPLRTPKPKDLRPDPVIEIAPRTVTTATASSAHPGSDDGASHAGDARATGTKKHRHGHDDQQRGGR